jgi:hypothetical protein
MKLYISLACGVHVKEVPEQAASLETVMGEIQPLPSRWGSSSSDMQFVIRRRSIHSDKADEAI